MAEILEDRDKLKRGLVKVLECVTTISSAAAVVNPIFGVAGSLIRVVLHHVDDEDIKTLKQEFGSVNRALDEISQQNHNALLQIKKETLDSQYCHVEDNLRNQFRKFMEIVEARPDNRNYKIEAFKESYADDLGDQNLYTLYEGVMGKPKLFSRPILEVYMKHSQGDRRVMERLCTRLTYLFCIGLIALMGYTAVMEDDEEGISEEWAAKMEDILENRDKLKRGLVKVLECVATISSAAAVVNPIFGVAGSLIRVVLHHVDDEDIKTLKQEFGSVNRALDEISQQNHNALLQIKKETQDSQYCHVEDNLRNQFRKFMEIVEARPDNRNYKIEAFKESYADDLGDQNLHTLYEGVMGKHPILNILNPLQNSKH
ncbi:hypothetical protein SKAU_G00221570 [Synaphobranchus kaupii]|uniref:Rapunzel n=1 Tax=Synaphobranchus kaupii TaxID=118154 RepID=A0A9Q1FB04_SYNKA|nr:hypothetical protein SKAU_G00221570 [Synaphobranchus kaupii]